jgi:hypothetical protein
MLERRWLSCSTRRRALSAAKKGISTKGMSRAFSSEGLTSFIKLIVSVLVDGSKQVKIVRQS